MSQGFRAGAIVSGHNKPFEHLFEQHKASGRQVSSLWENPSRSRG
jgi:hypothetical protein